MLPSPNGGFMKKSDIYSKGKVRKPNYTVPVSEQIFKCWACEDFFHLPKRCPKCKRCAVCCAEDTPEDGTLLKTFTEDKE